MPLPELSAARDRLPPYSARLLVRLAALCFSWTLVAGLVGAADAQTASERLTSSLPLDSVADRSGARTAFHIERATTAISIDGELTEEAWQTATPVSLQYETSPGDNTPAPVDTECLLTFDVDRLYFACVAHDPNPQRIRAYITDRDDIRGHDRVGIALDPFNDARRAFEFSVSALGVQRDARFDEQEGWDDAWDAIWHSAGRVTETGYVVEAAIPFKSLRFPGGDEIQTWGFFALRQWPRSEAVELQSMSWNRANSCRLCQANLLTGIAGVSPGANLELTPTFTSGRTDQRKVFPGGDLETGSFEPDPGLDVRWGVTPNLSFNATFNPDFSQVEADVAQLDVNNRFALFFPEKRPFFLEGGDFFATPLQAVFSRTIADPSFGTKLTGKLGDNAVGTMIALDEVNNLLIPGNQGSGSSSLEGRVLTAVARLRRDVGASNTVGILYAGREGNDYHNRVVGTDLFFRPLSAVTARFQYLRSQTAYPIKIAEEEGQPTDGFGGNAARLFVEFDTRNWFANLNSKWLDRGFRADAGFITQVDIRGISAWGGRRFWGDNGAWYTQLGVEGGAWHNETIDGRLTNQGFWGNVWLDGPLQTALWINPNFKREFFEGETHELVQLWSGFGIRPSGAVGFEIWGNVGDAIDFANARKAFRIQANPRLKIRVGRHVDVELRHTLQRLSVTEGDVFTANVSQFRGVYNFNPRTFVRVTLQFRDTDRNPLTHESDVDPEQQSLFSQVLLSYKVNPQTALFLGYSDMRVGLTDPQFNQTELTQTARTFFLKLGYAFRP